MANLMKPSTFAPWMTFRDEFDRLFGGSFPFLLREGNGEPESMVWTPRMDFSETENDYAVSMDLPGLDKKEVNVNIEDRQLMVSGERKEEKKEEGRDFHRIERSFGRFYRSVTLPKGAIADKAKATFKDGVLTVTIPKEEGKVKTQKIEVK